MNERMNYDCYMNMKNWINEDQLEGNGWWRRASRMDRMHVNWIQTSLEEICRRKGMMMITVMWVLPWVNILKRREWWKSLISNLDGLLFSIVCLITIMNRLFCEVVCWKSFIFWTMPYKGKKRVLSDYKDLLMHRRRHAPRRRTTRRKRRFPRVLSPKRALLDCPSRNLSKTSEWLWLQTLLCI